MKLSKKLGWIYLLGVAVLIAAFLVFRRESFGGYVQESGKYIDAYTSSGPATYPLEEAVRRCNSDTTCLGVTQEPGGTGFSLRAKATMGSRAGAVSYRKPANAWVNAGFSITPAMTPLSAGGAPYSNTTVYKVGDIVTLNGKTYKMVEGAGAPGYSPERPGDRLWQVVPVAASGPQPYDNGKTYKAGESVTYMGKMYKMTAAIGAGGYAPPAFPQNWQEVDAAGNPVVPPPPPAIPNAGSAAVTGGPAQAATPGPSALQAPIGSATVMSGSPASVPSPNAGVGGAPPTVVIPAQTPAGTYLLRQVF